MLLDLTRRRSAEEELRQRVAQQGALAALSQQALAKSDLGRLFEEAIALVTDTLGVGSCTILAADRPDQTVSVVNTYPAAERRFRAA